MDIKTGIPSLELVKLERTLSDMQDSEREEYAKKADIDEVKACLKEDSPIQLVGLFSQRVKEVLTLSTYERGRVARSRENFEEAERLFLEAIDNEEETVALIELGLTIMALGRADEGFKMLYYAIILGHTGAHKHLGELIARIGHEARRREENQYADESFEEASAQFDAATAAGDKTAHFERGCLYFDSGNTTKMLEQFGLYEEAGFELPPMPPHMQKVIDEWKKTKAN